MHKLWTRREVSRMWTFLISDSPEYRPVVDHWSTTGNIVKGNAITNFTVWSSLLLLLTDEFVLKFLESLKPKEAHSGPYFDLPCQPGQLFWSKMASTGVLHIVQHLLSSSRTSLGYFRHSEVRFSAIFAVSDDLFYKAEKRHFFQNRFSQNLVMGEFLGIKF